MEAICYRCRFGYIFLALVAILTLPFTFAQSDHVPLIDSGEKVVISFAIEDSDKVLTVATANDGSYIVYRFGKENAIELEYPANFDDSDTDDSNSWDKFTHKYHVRDVGDNGLALEMSYLEFRNYGYTYRVYDAYSEEFAKSFVGVIVVEHSTGNEYDIRAVPDSKFGGLTRLDAYATIEARAAF